MALKCIITLNPQLYKNFTNRIHFISADSGQAKKALQNFLSENAESQNSIPYPKIRYDCIVSIDPNLLVSQSFFEASEKTVMASHVKYLNMTQGKKHINNFFGNTSRISELALALDKKILLGGNRRK